MFLKIISSIFILGYSLLPYAMDSADLSIDNRPHHVIEKVNTVFSVLASENESKWGYNGNKNYHLANIDEYSFLLRTILNSDRREFFWLDIGAGDFQLSAEICGKVNADQQISNEVKVHLISLRGEQNPKEEIFENGKCKIYNYGGFKIEDIRTELAKRNLRLDGQLDFITSAMCFRHLVDPMGTFRETYKLLRPETGIFVFDGFYFDLVDGIKQDEENITLFCLFSTIQARVLMQPVRTCRGYFTFVLVKPRDVKEILPLRYVEETRELRTGDSNGGIQLKFAKTGAIKDYVPTKRRYETCFQKPNVLMGNESVFDFLNNLKVWRWEDFEFIKIELR